MTGIESINSCFAVRCCAITALPALLELHMILFDYAAVKAMILVQQK